MILAKILPSRRAAILVLGGLAAFGAYFAMYAFRKPFSSATYAGQDTVFGGIDYKTALLIAQVIGYALSKLIGIRVIAEFGQARRAQAILALIGLSWIALVGFALVRAPWNIGFLFLNGLPLGMIWGLVFSYIEGRRASEALGAMLCASFILSSGVVKSIAVLVMEHGVSVWWMPAATGLLFAPLLIAALWMLERLPPPDDRDRQLRTQRVPMDKRARGTFLRDHGFALVLLISGYVLLTMIRDLRDNFAVEIWTAMGRGNDAAVFSQTELPVAAICLLALGCLMLVRNNLHALLAMHGIILTGAIVLGVATLAFERGLLSPMAYMTLTGAGLYLAYTPFNAMLFDRMIAAIGTAGNAGFLIYIADSSGYVGSVALLLYRNLGQADVAWLRFYMDAAYATSAAVAVCIAASAAWFAFGARLDRHPAAPLGTATHG